MAGLWRTLGSSVLGINDTGSMTASTDELIACPDCDALFRAPVLKHAQRIDCPHCHCRISEKKNGSLQRSAAFASAAAVLFVVAHFFPFLSIEAGSRGNQTDLFSSVGALYSYGSPGLACMVAIFIVAAPAAAIVGILYVLLPLLFGRKVTGARTVCRLVFDTLPWNMIEVFMLGILVSLLKLSKLATVHLGISFWAFAVLILCVTASFSTIDRLDLWRRLEALSIKARGVAVSGQ